MKPTLTIYLLLAVTLCACGNGQPEGEPSATVGDSDKNISHSSNAVVDAPDKQPSRHEVISATGKTTDNKAVKMQLDITDNQITGSLIVNSQSFIAEGMLNSHTIRCWLRSKSDESFRGNLVATRKNTNIQGRFTLSNNAGESVISGTISH